MPDRAYSAVRPRRRGGRVRAAPGTSTGDGAGPPAGRPDEPTSWEVTLSAGIPTRPGPVTVVPGTAAFGAAVEQELAAFFATRAESATELGPVFIDAVDALQAFVLRGGKRTRPGFAWMGWLGAGGDPAGSEAHAVLRACSALELVQACALIHDDIIDASRTRRRFPTVHVDFEQRHRDRGWHGDSAHYGESVAILLGDLALAWSDDMVHRSGLNAAAQFRFAPVWAAMRTEVLGGQLLDVHGEAGGDESVAAALRINRYKTAAYTVERPLHLGAALADAEPGLIAAYRTYGTTVGTAFQLRDDLLGVFGDPAVTGKPSGDDLREGKRTVLVAEALQRAATTDAAAADRLRAEIGTELSEEQVATLRALLVELGAVDAVEARITELTEQGLHAVATSSAEPAAKERLRTMALAATRRAA